MSPLGNVIHVNQNMLVGSMQQGNAQNRVDIQAFARMEDFNDKLKELQEVRPTEETHHVDEDSEQEGQEQQQEQQEREKKESREDDEGSSSLLDIKV